MTVLHPPPSAAARLPLASLPPAEASLVRLLRLWDDGPEAQDAVRAELTAAFGTVAASQAGAAIDRFLDLLFARPRRALRRHRPGCPGASPDEAAVAALVAAAACGAREDALMIGFSLVRADVASALVRASEQMGLLLRLGTDPARSRAGAILH